METPAEIVQWYRSTGLRPFLEALPKTRHEEFLELLTDRLNTAYNTKGAMTFHFKRLFIWASKPI
jgi:trans-aconitate 2-methyltransferase